MKYIILTFVSVFFIVFNQTAVMAQTDCFPVNENIGQIELTGKVLLEGNTKKEIFNKLIIWGASKQSSQTQGEVMIDREAGVYKIYNSVNYKYKEGYRTMFYAITMISYEGYFKYIVNDFIMNKKPMENFIRIKKDDVFYEIAFDDICKKVNYTVNSLKVVE